MVLIKPDPAGWASDEERYHTCGVIQAFTTDVVYFKFLSKINILRIEELALFDYARPYLVFRSYA